MDLPDFTTLSYWNALARNHLPELVMVLTAAIVALADRHVRRLVHRYTSSRGKVLRFAAFLIVCTAGYAALALGVAAAVRAGLTAWNGAYLAPIAAGVLVLAAVEAQRQQQI